jgi:hypothetical protein
MTNHTIETYKKDKYCPFHHLACVNIKYTFQKIVDARKGLATWTVSTEVFLSEPRDRYWQVCRSICTKKTRLAVLESKRIIPLEHIILYSRIEFYRIAQHGRLSPDDRTQILLREKKICQNLKL